MFALVALVALDYVSKWGRFLWLHFTGSPQAKRGFGPYRESSQEAHDFAINENRELKSQLGELERKSAQKDLLIEQLWFRCHGAPFPRLRPVRKRQVNRAQLAGLVSLATASGMVVGALNLLPAHAGSDAPHRATTTMVAQTTWGGEITMNELANWNWSWQCRDRRPTLLAIGSNVIVTHCHIPLPAFARHDFTLDGDRTPVLWFFPERTGPATLTYILN
jgi:hypothetical protein